MAVRVPQGERALDFNTACCAEFNNYERRHFGTVFYRASLRSAFNMAFGRDTVGMPFNIYARARNRLQQWMVLCGERIW